MPDRIPGITMLHQMSPLHCWAACAESVLQYYGINQNQQQINAAFGGGPMGGTPAPALNHHHVLASRTDHPQRIADRTLRAIEAERLKRKLKEEIRAQRPVVVGLYNAFDDLGGNTSKLYFMAFAHAMVIFGYDKATKRFEMLDPGQEDVVAHATALDLVSGWLPYGKLNRGFGMYLLYGKRFFYTKRP
jgi:ABC-type bacteriocin/lantibiotic exporter with double-glycine peptidase domain